MVWRVEKEGKSSYLGGTAHFFPVSLKQDLEPLIRQVEQVLFEGPLDQESMNRIAQYGKQWENGPSIYDALDPEIKKEINQQFRSQFYHTSSTEPYFQVLTLRIPDFLEAYTRGVRPWMAFFNLWASYLNWTYSIDMEAFHIAQKLEKKVHFLETIEEQFEAMDGIPFERIMDYIHHIKDWKSYKRQFLNYFLEGDLEKLMSRTPRFPTRCDSILGNRDPRFFRRIRDFFKEGSSVAFLGISHIPAMKKMFLDEGYKVTQEIP
jgi:uncharacterized protein YbaP (TraB family)